MQQPSHIHALLHQLSATFSRDSDQILQEQLGIGLSQFKILTALGENPATQQRHIAITLGQTEASISRQVKLMLHKGLLESRANPANRREHRTTLTLKGERMYEAAQDVLYRYQAEVLAPLNPKQRMQLLELLTVLS